MATADVAVMGGGIMGLAVAWALCRRGARVRVIEARRIGAGASGGVVGGRGPPPPPP
ncbi:MAG: FAD-dependent oxidoreductase, partial [Gemmobacter sp.]